MACLPNVNDHLSVAFQLIHRKSVALKGFCSSIFLFILWRMRKEMLSESCPLKWMMK